jgi:hypothetical protein
MNRRETRAREYYGYALIAGISIKDARKLTPGWIMDMYKIRAEHDIRVNGGKIIKRNTGL